MHQLNTQIEILNRWFQQNRQSLNVAKTKVMLFDTQALIAKQGDFCLEIRGQEVEHVHAFKYLGVMLDPLLSFHELVKYSQSKTYGNIRVLDRARSFIDKELYLSLYTTLVLPLLGFNDYVYDCLGVNDAYTLQKLQNAALGSILHVDHSTPLAELHKKAGFLFK